MAAAIQHYLNTVLLKEAAKAKVIKVCELNNMTFEVTLTDEVAKT
jgi:hypothetical protein